MYNQTIAAEFTDWSADFTGVASSTAPPVGTGINYWELHPALSYVYLVGLLLQMVLGNAGNALVIGSVAVDKRLRKESNILILNLALADLCVTGFVDPFSLLGLILGPDFFIRRSGLCHLIGSVCLISCVCSLWTIAAISVNRYTLLCKGHLYTKIYTNQNTVLISICLWITAFLLDLPNYLDWGDHGFDMKTMACSYDRLASYSYTVFFITTIVTVPLITVCVCNINIFMVFLKSRKRVRAGMINGTEVTVNGGGSTAGTQLEKGDHNMLQVPETRPHPSINDSSSSSPSTQQSEITNAHQNNHPTKSVKQVSRLPSTKIKKVNLSHEFRLAKTLCVIFTVFCICWSPYAILCLVDPQDRIGKLAYVIAIQMAHISSCLNSILYAAMNKSFRDGYVLFLSKIFGCCKK